MTECFGETLLSFTENGDIVSDEFEVLMESPELDVLLAALAETPPDLPKDSELSIQVGRICNALVENLQKPAVNYAPGLLEVCLSVLLRHTKDERVIHGALRVLGGLLSKNAEVQSRLGELKGPQLVVRSMISMRQSKPVQLAGCKLLLGMTPRKENREIMGQFFAVEVVLWALKAFGEDEELVLTCCAFLANASYGSAKNKELIAASGGLKAIVKALKKNKDSADITTWGALSLRNLAIDNDTNQKTMFEAGVIRVLLWAMVKFRDNEKVMVHSVAVLYHLVDGTKPAHADAAQQVVDLRGIDIIVRSMKSFRAETTLHHCGIGCMRALVGHSESYAEIFLAGGGLEAVLSSMIAFRTTEQLQTNGIELIGKLCRIGKDVRSRIISAGGLNTISISLKTHIGNEAMVEMGLSTIQVLRGSRKK